VKDKLHQPESFETPLLEKLVGYLNFSSGSSDPHFLHNLNELFRSLKERCDRSQHLEILSHLLLETPSRLQSQRSAFADVTQAKAVIPLLTEHLLPAYREFHRDLLFHQEAVDLWQPFFLGRAWEAILLQGPPWNETQRIVQGALSHLNDFVGYRPVATLHQEQLSEPYAHEFVRPIPLFISGAGVAVGPYEQIIKLALAILANTDEDILARAWFDLEKLEEIALDPRAYDFDHPVNRRPNYHFGQWDPHHITNDGYYSRYVVQQITLDALCSRCKRGECPKDCTTEQCWQEAASVLAGTILMAAGISGDGPGRHDSSVTLSTLVPQIAAYRDVFYEQLLMQTEGSHRKRLQEEAQRYHQPFGAVRQHLNHELAQRRAMQMQRVHLAYLFARLGFPEAAQKQANLVRVPSARMLSDIYCRLTSGHDEIDAGNMQSVADSLGQIDDLMHRAIECGALVDPWNVVGFAGNFSLFPALENSVHDWRVDDLLELVEQVLDLCARAWSESAAVDDSKMEEIFSSTLSKIASWWDQFATYSVEGIPRLVAKEIEVSANLVAGALNAWHKAGAAAGDIAFWRMFVDQFDNSKAFQLVIEALLDHDDTVASMALMMQWVSQKERTPLEEGDSSFHRLAFRWLDTVEAQQSESGQDHWSQMARFFEFLEANAEEYWQAPSLMLDPSTSGLFEELDDADFFDDEEEDLDDDEEDDDDSEAELFQAAYEEMIYRDSSDDGREGDIVDDDIDYEDTEWEYEVQRLEQRLDFLTTVSNLWKHAATVWGTGQQLDGNKQSQFTQDPERSELFRQWLNQASANCGKLVELLETVHSYRFALPGNSHESLVEYDRLRTIKEALLQKIITTCVETADAARLLAATRGKDGWDDLEPLSELIDPESVQILREVLAGNPDGVRQRWDSFLATLEPRPLLYIPHSRGGKPRQIVSTRCLQHLLHDLLSWLPQLGLISETCQLLEVGQRMESEHPVGAVTEFDRLFESGYKAIVRSMIVSAEAWDKQQSTDATQHADHLLIDALQKLTEQQLDLWLQHSRSLRLSVVERLIESPLWNRFVEFVERYGSDLFDQRLMSSLGNLRGILHQGVDIWVDSLEEQAADDHLDLQLIKELDSVWPREEAIELLTLAIEAVAENYQVYRDYNTTTTQSDHGELLYTLIDFLRLRAAYDRVAWNLKPVVWAHETLIRHRRLLAAEMWCQAFAERTTDAADDYQAQLEKLGEKYGMRLATISERVGERFVRPLLIDRVRALVEPAFSAEGSERQEAFAALELEINSLAEEPSGAGLDLPDWLAAMEDEVTSARSHFNHQSLSDRLVSRMGMVQLSWEELLEQLNAR